MVLLACQSTYANSVNPPKGACGVGGINIHKNNDNIVNLIDALNLSPFDLSPQIKYKSANTYMLHGEIELKDQCAIELKFNNRVSWQAMQSGNATDAITINLPGMQNNYWLGRQLIDLTCSGNVTYCQAMCEHFFSPAQGHTFWTSFLYGFHCLKYNELLHMDMYDNTRNSTPQTLDICCTNLPLGVAVGVDSGMSLDNFGLIDIIFSLTGQGAGYINYATKSILAIDGNNDSAKKTKIIFTFAYSAMFIPKLTYNLHPIFLACGLELLHVGQLCCACMQLSNSIDINKIDVSGIVDLIGIFADVSIVF